MPRILVVDDDPMVLEVLKGLLEEDAREVRTASTAAGALEQARQFELALALVDKNLGPDDGLVLSRRLKEVQPEMEVILITGYASIESAIEAVQIGAFDYLTKPIADFGNLGLKVQSAIEKSGLRRSQRALMERLMECEVRHRRVIDAAPEAVVLYDAATERIVEANEAAITLYGYEPSELLALTAHDLRGDAPIAAAGPHPVLQRHRRKDGSEFDAEVTFTDFVQQGRKLQVQSARDVSERLRADEQRRELEDRLRSAQKLDAIGRLAGGLAHDFSNLLAVMQAHVDFLGDMVQSDDARAELDGLRRIAARGSALTRQLLLFGRRGPREEQVVELAPLVVEVRQLVSRLFMENIEVRASVPPAPLFVAGSAEQMLQVILNLAVNARDAMPSGGTLSIELEEARLDQPRLVRGGSLRAGRYAQVRVRDTGCGMSRDVLDRLFEPFFTTKPEGTGLGLATAFGIVAAADGGMDVESQEGKGSTVRVWLPITDAAPDSQPAARPDGGRRGRGETVLLVEDEELLRMMVARSLTASGYEVIEACDGEAGLRAAALGKVDILVTDVVMPRLDGPRLAQELRRTQPGLRVLYMSGWSEQASRPELRKQPFLHKPFTTGVLLAELRRVLDRPDPPRPPEAG